MAKWKADPNVIFRYYSSMVSLFILPYSVAYVDRRDREKEGEKEGREGEKVNKEKFRCHSPRKRKGTK